MISANGWSGVTATCHFFAVLVIVQSGERALLSAFVAPPTLAFGAATRRGVSRRCGSVWGTVELSAGGPATVLGWSTHQVSARHGPLPRRTGGQGRDVRARS